MSSTDCVAYLTTPTASPTVTPAVVTTNSHSNNSNHLGTTTTTASSIDAMMTRTPFPAQPENNDIIIANGNASTTMETSATMDEVVQSDYTPRHSVPKTSIGHPINISWVLPNDYLPLITFCDLPDQLDIYDLTNPVIEQQLAPQLERAHHHRQQQSLPLMGNLALSSCPGKKVQLTGPVRGRAAINRDLDLDFTRMRSFGITTIVCCLEDSELNYLGASWELYAASAKNNGLQVLRLPMVEGSCPDTLEEVDNVINIVNSKIWKGENVLTHCRGGVGRAGLFACCWLINNTLCLSAERAIRFVRVRRSPKAIETMRQAEFVIHYAQFIARKLEQQMLEQQEQRQRYSLYEEDQQHQQQNESSSVGCNHHPSISAPLDMAHTDQTLSVPSVIDIGQLEQSMRNKPLISSTATSTNGHL
ncbi:unnamed protein product [Absidia cylindrospora]